MMVNRQIEYVEERCITCDMLFFVPKEFQDRRRKDKMSFYCPLGHAQAYAESEADRLRRERDRLKQDAARLEEEKAQAWRAVEEAEAARCAAEAAKARIEKRVGAGICPCCSRSFSNVSRHMKAKHPDVPFVPATKKAARVRTKPGTVAEGAS